MRIAIIGSGIAGLGACWALRHRAEITLFEKQNRIGGHSHTVRVEASAQNPQIDVDTGFIVYNCATYPNLIALFDALRVPTQLSDMSFAVSLEQSRYEYAGDNPAKLIGSARNLLRIGHWRLLRDLLRFLKDAEAMPNAPERQTLGEWMDQRRYSREAIDNHILPMAAAIWSAAPASILKFPAASFGRFYANHGLLQADVKKRPDWRTVSGGSRIYVDTLLAAAKPEMILNAAITQVAQDSDKTQIIFADGSRDTFDHVIIATHADEAASLLGHAHQSQKQILRNFSYSANQTYLHSDASLMPQRRRLWASWNYLKPDAVAENNVFVSYWMNRLQNLPRDFDLFVTLNPPHPPLPAKTYKHMIYHHPQFDRAALAAQRQLRVIQGGDNLWFCGSYFGYGFHEDALASGLAVATALGGARPWDIKDVSPAFENATPVTL